MNFFSVKELPKKKIKEGIRMCSAYLDNLMLTYFEFDQGQEIPSHKHPHEQITFILEGEMQFKLGDEIKNLRAGEGVTVPSNMMHSVCALTPVKVVDAWNPIREDYVVSWEKL
jgi:quercetin dioxygenase-like cupin family protein